ncbi:MAG TPA: PSD1 and planctomycete cytochrome C domain-containing protein [Gemmatales bacterium]|nr:PSD1 and planctomycete cytochrome C domain-containing protein [Gemmatales bacterium]
MRLLIPVFIILLWFCNPVQGQRFSTEQLEFFEKQIRPVLTEKCLVCHGANLAKVKLRLDSRDAVIKGSSNGAVVIAGLPAQSRLIEALRYQGDVQMPPSGKLTNTEIKAFEKWIEIGLPWPENPRLTSPETIASAAKKHWAFQPIVQPKLPTVCEKSWVRTPIDRFILASLETIGVQPSALADKYTLIRRATFDLHGLPPTMEEVKSFEADTSPNAYPKLIDRLLASPRYGERWARHWLDVARYADNKGYVFFEDKNYPWAFTFRDYVIEAFNKDLPFDRFIQEQLAADQLKLKDSKALAALGFLTVGGHFMNNTHDIIDDRIDVVSRGLMGLTVTCARCHDHKFDPVPQADYYSLYGVFRSSTEPLVPPLLVQAPTTKDFEKFALDLAQREKKLYDFVHARHQELVNDARKRVTEYLLAVYASRNQPPADDFMLIADKGDLNPTMINRWRVYLDNAGKRNDLLWKPWHAFAALAEKEFASRSADICQMIHREKGLNPLVKKAFASPPTDMKDVAKRYGQMLEESERRWQYVLIRSFFRRKPPPTKLEDADTEQLREVLYGSQSPADAPLTLDWGFLSLFPDRATQEEYKKLIKEVEVHSAKGPARAMVLNDSVRPFEPQVFLRGQPQRLGEHVPRQFLAVVNPGRQPFNQGSGRLELAHEVTSKRNPLTARVIVNRVWMHHFGVGLVPTPSDFGLRGSPPSHSELLDYLASDFMENGWSLKRLHRLIMSSAVYQQQSQDRPHAQAKDSENRLLWKMNRHRLEFEALHDSTLSVSGQLDATMGGPAVPLFTGKNRRAIYGYVDRLDFPSLLTTFDVPNPASSTPLRNLTTVAPQALFLMNGPMLREAAKRTEAMKEVQQEPTHAKLLAVYRILFQRVPFGREVILAQEYLGEKPSQERWIDFIHGLMMTNEFAFVD